LEMPIVSEESLSFEEMIVNVGAFVFGETFGGVMTRTASFAEQNVVNAAQGAGFACAFFEKAVK
ncbi:MAG: hypothetical protein ACXVP5_07760, partial [Tumebacillaceae bacterium]